MRLFVFTLCFCLVGVVSYGQDQHLTQYYTTPIYLNPAMTGMFNGGYRAHIHYRNQWKSVINNAYSNNVASFDMPVEKTRFSVGGLIMNNHAGTSDYNAFNFLLSGAYDFIVSARDRNNHISIGLQGGIIQKSIDFSKLMFEDQYVAYSSSFDPSMPTSESFGKSSVMVPDLNAGIMYYYSGKKSLFNPFAGISIFHLSQPDESFLSNESKLPRRFVLHGGAKLNTCRNIQLTYQVLFMKQAGSQEFLTDLVAQFKMRGTDRFLLAGFSFSKKYAKLINKGL